MTLEIYFVIICVLNIIYIILMNFVALKVMQSLGVQPALLPSGQFQQMREYRAQLEKDGEAPWFMLYLKNAKGILCFYAALWISFIFLIVLQWLL